jgi:ABC-type antimicrobial peptide transport system permease subunit
VAHAQSTVPGSFLRTLKVAVRVRSAPAGLVAGVREEVAAVDPLLAAADVRTLDRRMATALRRVRGRFHAVLLGVLGTLALILSAVGVFALQAFQVRRRTREIGLRMALGARLVQVVRLVLVRGLRIAVTGTALGVLAALALSGALEHLLYGVEPLDPLTLSAVALLLTLTVLAASALPALRAARVDPMTALRSG